MKPSSRPGAGTGAVSGIIAAAAAMGIGQLLAGLTAPESSPVIAVGQAAIDATPLPVKTWATSTFGTGDKDALLTGVLVVLAAFSAAIGIFAMRRLRYGMAGLAVLTAIGLSAVLTRPTSHASWVWPTLVGAVAGGIALMRLVRTAEAALLSAPAQAVPEEAPEAAKAPGAAEIPEAVEAPGAAKAPEAEAPPAEELLPADGLVSVSRAADSQAADSRAAELSAPDLPTAGRPAGTAPSGSGGAGSGGTGSGTGVPRSASPGGIARGGNRRAFLTTAGVAVAAAAIGEFGGRDLATRQNVTTAQQAIRFPRAAVPAPPLPAGINPPVKGLSSFITPNGQFYRVDTALVVPEVDPATWMLRIHGMVGREVTMSFAELLKRPLIEDYVTLCCVSNPVGGSYIGNAKWLGASLASLLREARPQAGADQLLCTSTDGFTSGTPLEVTMDGRDALVAVAMNGTALPTAHGFPARLVVPGLYGYVSACKWVTDIEVTKFSLAHAYWTTRGWSQQAPVKTESRIDVPASGQTVSAGKVAVAGVAWAQHKGIDAVEVRVDRGPWQEATLAAVPGIDTWRQWVWEWDATSGSHLLEARATDKTGYTQTSVQEPEAPNGATGYPQASVTVS